MFRRQTTGSVICTSCGVLVGVNDDRCYNCGRRNPGLWGFAPALRSLGNDLGFVPFVMGTCIVLFVLTLLLSGPRIGMRGMGFLSPAIDILFLFGATGVVPTFGAGRWWTVISASWLHGSLLHIIFNLMSLRQLAPAVADMYGAGRMVIIYTAAGLGGFALSCVAGAYLPALPFFGRAAITVGASASISGLLGAVLYYGHRSGSSMARAYATQNAIGLVLIGMFMPNINNYAHLGGFGAGYLASKLLDPLKPERGDHIAVALICLAISILSVAASVLHGLQFFRQ